MIIRDYFLFCLIVKCPHAKSTSCSETEIPLIATLFSAEAVICRYTILMAGNRLGYLDFSPKIQMYLISGTSRPLVSADYINILEQLPSSTIFGLILWSSSLKLSCLVIVRAMFSKKASCRSLSTRVTQLNGLALQIFPSLSYQIKL